MIVVMKPSASDADIEKVINRVRSQGLDVHLSTGEAHTIVGVLGNTGSLDQTSFEVMTGVESAVRISQPFKVASREFTNTDTIIDVRGVKIGGEGIVVMAGPCSVDPCRQILESAYVVKEAGAHILRGGAYKPRSSPYSFQGMGEEGLELLAEAVKPPACPSSPR